MILAILFSLLGCHQEEELRRGRCYDLDFFETLDRAEHRERVMFCKDILVEYNVMPKLKLPLYDELMVEPTLLEDPEICSVVLADAQDTNAAIALYAVWVTARYKTLYRDRPPSCVEAAFPDGPPITGWVPTSEHARNPASVPRLTREYLQGEQEWVDENLAKRKLLEEALPECKPPQPTAP